MRLLYITNQVCGAAGLERVLSIKASYLVEKLNYEVHIITLNQNNNDLFYPFNEKINYHDLSVKGNPISYITNYWSKIKSIVREVKPDVISVCDDGLKAFTLPYLLKKYCPIIYERHVSKNVQLQTENASIVQKLKTKAVYLIMGVAAKKFDKFVVLTDDNLKEWHLNNIMVIENPLSFYTKSSSKLQNKKVLVVGRHCFQKGYDRLLQSWKIVTEKYPDWHLDIYGKFQHDNYYQKLATDINISDSVSFFKPVKNIDEKYEEASIYAMSSRFEGFGMVLIEAMAYGVPCVSFNCPCGPKGIITDQEDGFLVENGNVKNFAEKIMQLISNDELRLKMGGKAKTKARQYLPEYVVPKWDVLFKDLTRKR